MDASMEKMENLRWARILVKTKRGELPSSIEIGVEETIYHFLLWWEVMPLIRQKPEDCRGAIDREERDDGGARAGRRVGQRRSQGTTTVRRCDGRAVGRDGQEENRPEGRRKLRLLRRPIPLEALVDSALQNEAMRYEALSTLGGLWDSGNPSLPSLFSLGRTPEGEFFDHFGVIREVCQNGRESQGQGAAGTRASGSSTGFAGVEGGSVLFILQIQDSGEWGDLGFYGVYGPFTRLEREWLWEEVGAIRGIWEGPWCLGGDFNITLAQGERSRQGRITSAMRRFAEVVDELGLVDLQLQGGAFTWSGGRNSLSRAD
ncbi:hypothetical protein CK203_000933 [Vitis vinifera]|uniref:Endonuclease/exonuclease/phosphatase domain-containing protein n=1 Tax=Vitis vinifera TaxID=29760 RepID=A0A438KRU0_VITVI|nr:hypothetical protein CK203_000933 [Vitis vinifera]